MYFPNVPNLTNLRLDKTTDFLINLTADVIVIANGKDLEWEDGVDFETIIDGIEYQSKSTSRLTLDDRVDRGYVLSPPKFSGKSMQRIAPGFDSNNGVMDWETKEHPTPGYQE